MKLLNVMSYYKLNTLHMHLTDAGGWRIQMDKYPKLTSMGAYRTEKDWLKWWDGDVREFVPENTPGVSPFHRVLPMLLPVQNLLHDLFLSAADFPGSASACIHSVRRSL